jgi:hypothetical protein
LLIRNSGYLVFKCPFTLGEERRVPDISLVYTI